jgi:50S ribosomal protein L16 3-hydroxylase
MRRMPTMRARLLGERTVESFMRQHWQKRALLVRDAMPGFGGPLDRAALIALATRDDVESRLVMRERSRWSLAHGPFRRSDFRTLPARGWMLLVQGVNLHVAQGDALLRRFAFVPYARLDDLMVSYAAPGGGVGPHFDSYDVFLLQGFGRRRWRYGTQADLSLQPNRPLKILRRFTPKHDVVLGAGDMLYLPPRYAHDGVAIDECMTCSIGFRAPSAQELAGAFLDFLRDELDLAGRYADPDLRPTSEPARIGVAMRRRVAGELRAIRWSPRTVARFLGCLLSEPKPTVFFEPPGTPMALAAFRRHVGTHGLALDRRTQLLYDDRSMYINGEALELPSRAGIVRELANARTLDAERCRSAARELVALFHRWYSHGYVHPAA